MRDRTWDTIEVGQGDLDSVEAGFSAPFLLEVGIETPLIINNLQSIAGDVIGLLPQVAGGLNTSINGVIIGVTPTVDGAISGIVANPFTGQVLGLLPLVAGNINGSIPGAIVGVMPSVSGNVLNPIAGSVLGSVPSISGNVLGSIPGSMIGALPTVAGGLVTSISGSILGLLPVVNGSIASGGAGANPFSGSVVGLLPIVSGDVYSSIAGSVVGAAPDVNGNVYFVPPPGMAGWWDFADNSLLTFSGANITQANDKSGNNRHFLVTAGTSVPLTAGAIGGKQCVTFNGSQHMTTNTFTTYTGNVSTVYMVMSMATAAASGATAWCQSNASQSTGSSLLRCNISRNGTNAQLRIQRNNLTVLQTIALDAGFMATALYDGTNSNLYVGQTAGTPTAVSGAFGYNLYRIGNNTLAANAFSGNIGEILVYDAAHSAAQRAAVWAYLNSRWGT